MSLKHPYRPWARHPSEMSDAEVRSILADVDTPEDKVVDEVKYKFVVTRHPITQVMKAYDTDASSETLPFVHPGIPHSGILPVSVTMLSADCVEAVWLVRLY